MEHKIMIFALFVWWALGVAALFGSKKFWAKLNEKIPLAAAFPHRVMFVVFLMSVVLFPLVFAAPVFWAIEKAKDWIISLEIKRAAKALEKMADGKPPELAAQLKELAKQFKNIAEE